MAAGLDVASAIELKLAAKFVKRIREDQPVKGICIDKRWAWILGGSNLWRYDLKLRKLTRISLGAKRKSYLFASSKDAVFVAKDSELIRIEKQPLRLFRHLGPQDGGQSLGIQVDENSVFWIRTTGIYQYDDQVQLVALIKRHKLVNPATKAIYVPSTRRLWFSDGKRLSLYSYEDKSQLVIMRPQRFSITNLYLAKDSILVTTPSLVMIFAHSGSLVQSIPAKQGEHIVGSHVSSLSHAFLMNTGVLQINLLEQRKTERVFVASKLNERVRSLQVLGSYAGWIQGGVPRLFQLDSRSRSAAMMGSSL